MNEVEVREKIKSLLRKINSTGLPDDIERIKEEFKNVIKDANPLLIAMAENELINEGEKIENVMKACDIHLEIFKDAIRNSDLKVPDWHPIKDFQNDHKNILELMERLENEVRSLKYYKNYGEAQASLELIERIAKKLLEAENHNVRQENTLFPVLEKKGIEQPPAIMWHEHTLMKEEKKNLLRFLEERKNMEYSDFIKKVEDLSSSLFKKFLSHTQKEENILYVTALKVISDDEWKEIKEECDLLGYVDYKV